MRIRQQLTRRKKLRGGLNPSNDGVVGPILNININDPILKQATYDQEATVQAAAAIPPLLQDNQPAIQTSDDLIYRKVKNAENVPVITPGYLFATLNDISFDSKNLDTRLIFLGKLEKENSSEGSLPHFFYKFNVTPPAGEPEFESVNSSGTTERIPFPAVLLIRCVMGEDKYLKIKAVYVVAGNTNADKYFRNSNTIVANVNNLLKLEDKEEYQTRTTQNANDAPIIGKKTDLVLITSTWDYSNLSPVDPLIEFIKYELRTIDGNESNYALHRFKIKTEERLIRNAVRGVWMSATAPSGPPTISAGTKVTVGSVKTGLVTALKHLIFSGGKRTKRTKRTKRIKIKYSTKKSKRKAKANATKHNRFKGFKYMTSKRK